MSDEARLRPTSHRLGDLLDEMAAVTPGAEALVFRDQRLDYAGLKARADTFARALLAIGVKHGDRVALLVTNRPEWLIAAFAAANIAHSATNQRHIRVQATAPTANIAG